jgi:uncharacterized protein YggE
MPGLQYELFGSASRRIIMLRFVNGLAVFFALVSLPEPPALGQLAGSRAGLGEDAASVADLAPLAPDVAQGYIAIDGRAVVRVRATELRVVLAATGEAQTAQECQKTVDKTIERLKAAWAEIGIAPEKIVVDFIAILPRYEWSVEKQDGADVGIERKAGFRMQTNVHLAAKSGSEAQAAVNRAFQEGVTDIIAFDYWSNELDEVKAAARAEALEAAQGKAEVLLGAIFEQRPPAINVQEQTVVRYPDSLYHSFTNTYDESVTPSFRRDIPLIRAPRSRNTYYRGLVGDGDVGPRELPMSPEISVVSTVRLYFASPAVKPAKKKTAKLAKKKQGRKSA